MALSVALDGDINWASCKKRAHASVVNVCNKVSMSICKSYHISTALFIKLKRK